MWIRSGVAVAVVVAWKLPYAVDGALERQKKEDKGRKAGRQKRKYSLNHKIHRDPRPCVGVGIKGLSDPNAKISLI